MAGDNEDIVVSQRNEMSGHCLRTVFGSELNVYADEDCANKDNDRRSMSGIAVTLGGTVVSHASKTQRTVSLSTSETEYKIAGHGVK